MTPIDVSEFIGLALESFGLVSVIFMTVYIYVSFSNKSTQKLNRLKNKLTADNFVGLLSIFLATSIIIHIFIPSMMSGYTLGRGMGLGLNLIRKRLPVSVFEGADGEENVFLTPKQRQTLSSYMTEEQIQTIENDIRQKLIKKANEGLSEDEKKELSILDTSTIQTLNEKAKQDALLTLKKQELKLKRAGIEVDTMMDQAETNALDTVGKLTDEGPTDTEPIASGIVGTSTEVSVQEIDTDKTTIGAINSLEEEEEEEEEMNISQDIPVPTPLKPDPIVLNTGYMDRAPLVDTYGANRDDLGEYYAYRTLKKTNGPVKMMEKPVGY